MYKQYFEAPFLAKTESYYKMESERFIGENTVIDYMKKVEDIILLLALHMTNLLSPGRDSLGRRRCARDTVSASFDGKAIDDHL